MDEIIEVLDEETGMLTGKTISKDKAHLNGTWHGAIHLIIVNKDKTKTLFQQRSSNKKIYPNHWDIAVGGHISTKETPYEAVKRELQEELGLNPNDYDFEEISTVKESLVYENYRSNEFVTTYLVEADVDISKITLQKEEVKDVKWFTKDEVNKIVKENNSIPHVVAFDIINERLK